MELTQEQINELIASAASKAAEEAIKALPAVNQGGVQVVTDEADQPWAHPGEFFQAVKNAALFYTEDPRLRPLKATGLSEGVPADGGYLLQPQMAGGIIERMYNVGEILRRVSVDQIGPNSNSMLYNAIDESSRAAGGSAYGGILGYWLGEGSTKTASKPAFRQVELKLKKCAALCYATDELLGDAVALESWLTRTVPEALRFMVEDAIINGNGVGKPLGIMNSPCLVTQLRVDATEIDATDIANMWMRRWAGYSDYVWLVSSSIYGQLVNLVVGNWPVFVPAGGFAVAPYASIYGKPVIVTGYSGNLDFTNESNACMVDYTLVPVKEIIRTRGSRTRASQSSRVRAWTMA